MSARHKLRMCVQDSLSPHAGAAGQLGQPATHQAVPCTVYGSLCPMACSSHPRIFLPQVGAIGDEEDWVSLYEEENEPDAQTLEIPNLTPYTHYR